MTKVSNKASNKSYNLRMDRANNTIRGFLYYKARNEISKKTEEHILGQIYTQVWNQVWGQIDENIRIQILSEFWEYNYE